MPPLPWMPGAVTPFPPLLHVTECIQQDLPAGLGVGVARNRMFLGGVGVEF